MRNVLAMMSSDRQDWATPDSLYEPLAAEFGFTLDAAASVENAKCERFFTVDDNALAVPWIGGPVWCNPPYSAQLGEWVEKGWHEARCGETVVMLIPARTDTRWFHDYILGQAEIRFIKGRVRFVGAPYNAPFPSMIVVWRRVSPTPHEGEAT